MSNYIKLVNYSVKDVLPTGNANKIIRGTELDAEFAAIAANMATKGEGNNGTFTNTTLSNTTLNGNTTINGSTTVNGSMYFSTLGGGSFTFDTATFNNIFINNGFLDNVQIGLTAPSAGTFNSVNAVLLQADNAVLVNGTVTGTLTVPAPINGTDAVNKSYVDTAITSMSTSRVSVFISYASAVAGLGSLTNGTIVQVLVDETRGNSNAFYQVVAGALSFISLSDYYSSPSTTIASDTVQNMITKLLVKTGAIPGITGVVEADFTNLSY